MINPFELIESRLIRIEEMIKDLNKMSSASTTHDNQNFFHVSDIARMYKINVRTLYKYHRDSKITLRNSEVKPMWQSQRLKKPWLIVGVIINVKSSYPVFIRL